MKMTREEKLKIFERMLKRAPEIMTASQVVKFLPYGKNKVYRMIKEQEIPSVVYQGRYIVAKIDLIEFLADTCDQRNYRTFAVKGDKE